MPRPTLAETVAKPGPAATIATELDALRLLEQHGVPVVPVVAATTVEGAVAAAHGLGYPVVLKLSSADVLHKTELGGVALDLRDEQSVRDAFASVTRVRPRPEPASTA